VRSMKELSRRTLALCTVLLSLCAGTATAQTITARTFTFGQEQPLTNTSPGGIIRGRWAGIPSPTPTDWFGLFAVGEPNSNFREWLYVNCTKSATTALATGTCPMIVPSTLPLGTYELRLLSANGYTTLATSSSFTVTNPFQPVVSVSPSTIPHGQLTTINWSGIQSPTSTDWLAVYVPGASNSQYLDWIYVSCSKTPGSPLVSGSCSFNMPPITPGTYEVRLLSNNGFTALAFSSLFTVVP